MNEPVIIIYYKYTPISRAKDVMVQQRAVCLELGLKGRVLVASEGINGTLEGPNESIQKYIEYMDKHPYFAGINYKKSSGTGKSFPKLKVKARNEIVTANLGNEDINPWEITGQYLSADELQEWYASNKDFTIIDMRNDYEKAIGSFDNSLPSGMETFKDLKKVPKTFADYKDKTVVTVCTGGIRCEKASGYLLSQGFKNVYQLKDGIVTYMEKHPNKHFKGKLYVFDNRIVMGFETDAPNHKIIGRCGICNTQSEDYINCANNDCHKHFISCVECQRKMNSCCSSDCLNKIAVKQTAT